MPDASDNCILVPNPNQWDTNSDGFGNLCDPDYDNSGIVGITDLVIFQQRIGPVVPPSVDVDCCDHTAGSPCGLIDLGDYFECLWPFYGGAPGP